ncbi:hypothetical protein [Streptomyces sp. NBC_01304]|uniref:hypothetical protein n=1 Tax=Streptomyces sp. NBC_01304 TaxID=2903818 RepID=UPI002E152873|nr:hypothetical protein OG430_44685 [Streptomyces sp. NBC_01304]
MAGQRICTGPAFGTDNQGILQLRQPRPGAWPYDAPIRDFNGLYEDPTLGVWAPPQDRYAIRRNPDNYEKANQAVVEVPPKGIAEYPFDDIAVTNRSGARMRVHLLLHMRSYVTMYGGKGVGNVGAIDAKVWFDTQAATPWQEYATAYSGGFTWRESFIVDGSTWAEPGQTRTIHSALRYRNAEGNVIQRIQAIEMRPCGIAFVPFPQAA